MVTKYDMLDWWRLEPRLPLLILAGFTDGQSLALPSAVACSVVLTQAGPGIWEPNLGGAMLGVHKLITRGTVEEGLQRIPTVRKLLQDIESNTGKGDQETKLTLSRQTRQEVIQPQPDNGYIGWHTNTKKKE